MKKMKKFASLVLTAALAVTCFAGCGSNDNSSKSGSSADSTAESGTVFKIGGIGPLTGGAGAYGQAVQKGAQLAVEEINAAGGINGVKVEFKMEDDESMMQRNL